MPDSGLRNMPCLMTEAMQTKGQFGVFVVALEVLSKEASAFFNDIGLGKHGAAGRSEYPFSLAETFRLLLMSPAIAPSTGCV